MVKAVLTVDFDYWAFDTSKPTCLAFMRSLWHRCTLGGLKAGPYLYIDHHHMLKHLDAHPASICVNVDMHDDLGDRPPSRKVQCGDWAMAVKWRSQATYEFRYPLEGPAFCGGTEWNSGCKRTHGWQRLQRQRGLRGILDYDLVYVGLCLSPEFIKAQHMYKGLAYLLESAREYNYCLGPPKVMHRALQIIANGVAEDIYNDER